MPIIQIQGENERRKGVYYEVDSTSQPLGVGGMGQVYKGIRVEQNTGIRKEVAIKFLFDDLPTASIERAKREASIQISNENLVEMFGFIETEERSSGGAVTKHYHVVSELLRGVMLFDLLKNNLKGNNGETVPYAAELYHDYTTNRDKFAITIIKNLLSGIMALHDSGYIHRDIDPSNVMVTADRKIKLIDFGISKQLNSLCTEDHQLTTAGQFMGKASYAAPELAIGDLAHQNETTDIYAIGIMLYELVVGKLPFQGAVHEVLEKQLHSNIPLNEVTNKDLRKIIKKATAKKQSDRYQSASEFRVALEKVERKPNPNPSPNIFTKYKKIILGGAAIITIGGIITAISLSPDEPASITPTTKYSAAQIDSIKNALKNEIIDSSEDVSQVDTLTHVTIKSAGLIIKEALNELNDSATFSHGISELQRVVDKGYRSSSAAAYYLGCVNIQKYLPDSILMVAQKAIPQDIAKAEKLFQKAYELDSTDYRALYSRGLMYHIAEPTFNVSRDLTIARSCYEKALPLAQQAQDIIVATEITNRQNNM